jgi:hypothetical protein
MADKQINQAIGDQIINLTPKQYAQDKRTKD